MDKFEFLSVNSLSAALEAIDRFPEVRVVSGATNVMNYIRAGRIKACTLVDISKLNDLRYIKYEDGKVKIGGLTRLAEIAESEIIKEYAPALYMAANVFADPNTRNNATIAGNICDASPAADTAPSLLVFDAVVTLESVNGKREVAITDFFKGVGRTARENNELLTHIEFAPAKNSGFYKLGMRNAMAISVVTAAAAIELNEDDTVKSCKIALGSVAPTPRRAVNAEAALIGKKLDEEAYASIEELVRGDISPIDDVRATRGYRLGVAPVTVKRALELAK